MGREIHILRARVKARIGAMVNIKNDDVDCQSLEMLNYDAIIRSIVMRKLR